jgi:hypothetical protein
VGAFAVGAFAETAANDAAFCCVGTQIAVLADGIGVIADASIIPVIPGAIGAKSEIPEAGSGGMIHVGIGCGAIATDIDLVAARPLLFAVTMTGGKGGSEEDELDMTGLFHRGSFQGDKDLIVFSDRVEGGDRVAVADGGVYAVVQPYFVAGEENVVGAVCMYDGDAGLDGTVAIQ